MRLPCTSGRFIGQDPIGFESGDGTNLYAYVENRPTDRVDPLGLHGLVAAQVRMIHYRQNLGEDRFTNNISEVVRVRNSSFSFARFSNIISDTTTAQIVNSPVTSGSKVRVRNQVPDIRDSDDAGHIVGKQLGGSGSNVNNLFAQNRAINQGLGGNRIWRNLEDTIRKQVDYSIPVCNCNLTVNMTVSLSYDQNLTSLRPILISVSFTSFHNFVPMRSRFVSIPNPF